jgi:hypothetical protein
MEQIPTAEELGNKLYQPLDMSCNEFAIKLAIEFAKLHVEAALKAASKKAKVVDVGIDYAIEEWAVEKSSILNSYPSKNIK